jgi:hypothetical protein
MCGTGWPMPPCIRAGGSFARHHRPIACQALIPSLRQAVPCLVALIDLDDAPEVRRVIGVPLKRSDLVAGRLSGTG